jgi:hypothetical protein
MVSERSPLVTFFDSLSACRTGCLTAFFGTSTTACWSVVGWRSPWGDSLDIDSSVAVFSVLSEELGFEELLFEEL